MQLLHSNNHRRRRRLELDNATHIEQSLSSRVYQVDLRRDLQQLQLDTIFNYDDDGDDDAVEQFRCCCCFADRIRSFSLKVMAAAHRHDVLLFLSRHIPTLSVAYALLPQKHFIDTSHSITMYLTVSLSGTCEKSIRLVQTHCSTLQQLSFVLLT